MNDVKQVIVVRKDLQMSKQKTAREVALVSMKFLIDNNEAERGDELNVKLSPDEATWLLSGSFNQVVSVDNEDALQDLIFRAELLDVETHSRIDGDEVEGSTLTCAAFGPCDVETLDRIVGNLKPV